MPALAVKKFWKPLLKNKSIKTHKMKNFIIALALGIGIAACTPKQPADKKENAQPVFVEANLKIEGMTCDHCEASIQKGVAALAGIDSISANHEDSTGFVRFDSTKTNLKEISEAIVQRGYKVK
jgi:copper chaperone CopZ